MSETLETPQQRQARIRQQKREAKLAKSTAQERLDKITALSGRTPESIPIESPVTTPPVSQSPTLARAGIAGDPPDVLPISSMFGQSNDPEQMRMQQEYMRALLSGTQQGQGAPGQQPGMPSEEDPMMKMMQAMMGNMSGDSNAPGAGEMPFSADDISKMTGIPSFLTGMFLGSKQQAPPTPQEVSTERMWHILRIVISVLVGLYTIITVDRSIETFGQNPPAPATARNPFVIFLMGELLVNGARTVLSGRPVSGSGGIKSWIQFGKNAGRDGAILVFMLGIHSWWRGYA